jgi:DNA-binding LytR/AlgR family response regulator
VNDAKRKTGHPRRRRQCADRDGAVNLVLHASYEALEACDADEAIRILEVRNDIDLVFTDIQMLGTIDGIKLSTTSGTVGHR